MDCLLDRLKKAESVLIDFAARHAISFLRIAVAITYIWFGALKVFGVSPVAELVEKMSFGLPKQFSVRLVGILELVIGVALLLRLAPRLTLGLFFSQLSGTFLVFVSHPRDAFRNGNPLFLTMIGEFIVKNLVLFAAGIAIASSARRRTHTKASRKGVSPAPPADKPPTS